MNAEIEPSVRQLRLEPLDLFEQLQAVGIVGRPQQRQPVIEFLADGTRLKIQRLLELSHAFVLRGGVFIKGFAEIAILPQTCGGVGIRLGGQPERGQS